MHVIASMQTLTKCRMPTMMKSTMRLEINVAGPLAGLNVSVIVGARVNSTIVDRLIGLWLPATLVQVTDFSFAAVSPSTTPQSPFDGIVTLGSRCNVIF